MTSPPDDLQWTELRIRHIAAACITLEEARHNGSTLGRLLAAKVRDREAESRQPCGANRVTYEAALTDLCRDSHTFVAGAADAALVAFRTALRP